MKKLYYIFIIQILTLVSCSFLPGYKNPTIAEAPEEIREKAYSEAEKYIGMPYEWGGQDFPKGIDCSGLIVNVYYTATKGIKYSLPFQDATVKDLYNSYTRKIDSPQRGDLIFMGEDTSSDITHVAIMEKIENGVIYFIDSTYKPEAGLNGVTYRSYPVTDSKIKSYGRLILYSH